MVFVNLLPETVCQILQEIELHLEPEEVHLEARDERWLAHLPNEHMAWFAASEEGLHRLITERGVLRLLEAKCKFQTPRLLYEADDHSFDLRAKVVGFCNSASMYERVRQDTELAVRTGQAIGQILAEQHTQIRHDDVAGWLRQDVTWPESSTWIRERVPQVVADPDLVTNIDQVLTIYDRLTIDEDDRVLVHADVSFHNLALDPDTLAVRGIFDFDEAAWADRHHDFRYLIFDFDRPDILEAALGVYELAVGTTLSRDRILLYNAACAFTFLAYRLGTPPHERSCGRTLAEDLHWTRQAIGAVEICQGLGTS